MRSGFDAIKELQPNTTALFLDFDGTLADIADRPETVCVAPQLLADLQQLQHILSGALAIVTGREVLAIDQFMHPHTFTTSGVHGFQIRNAAHELRELPVEHEALTAITNRLRGFVAKHEGLLLEQKAASVALHFRLRPDLADESARQVTEALAGQPRLKVLHGKAVIEIKAHTGDKGQAIAYFMTTSPFAGRIPVFVGDDVTDEAGFTTVNTLQGISIKVGEAETSAHYLLNDPPAVRRWISELLSKLSPTRSKPEGDLTS